MAVGIALLGASVEAHDEHIPAVEACALLSLKAIYSRSQDTAEKLTQNAKNPAEAYFDSVSTDGHSLDDLFERKDIDAVIVLLPTHISSDVIKRAVAAGKHVLSEAPIAKDVETAEGLIGWYEEQDCKEIWIVGENLRFFEPLAFGAEQVRKMRGEIVTFSVKMYDLVEDGDHQHPKSHGGFLLDRGISFVAGLRSLLAAAGQEITHVAAFTSLLKQHLAPADTVHATVQISNGNSGTLSLSFGAEFKHAFEIQVVTDKGAVTVKPTGIIITTPDNKRGQTFAFKSSNGLRQEVAAFAQSIKNEQVDKRGTPEQALMDLKVFEAMLESSKEAGKVTTV